MLLIGAVAAIATVAVLIPALSSTPADSSNAVTPPAPYPVRVGATVVHGAPDAPRAIDIYEDFLCPGCGDLARRYRDDIAERIRDGRLRVTYHPLPLLDQMSVPPGYSLEAANAALCAADGGIFQDFRARLFQDQPEEGGAGYTGAQLTRLATELGSAPGFGDCVSGRRHAAALTEALTAVNADPVLRLMQSDDTPWLNPKTGKPVFRGAPTVVHDQRVVDILDSDWLSHLGESRPTRRSSG